MRVLAILTVLVLAACASQKPAAQQPAPAASSAAPDPYANGRAIYTTGRDLAGNNITASPPPLRTACIACHRANGSGGMHLPDGAVSADLRHKALTGGDHPYTVALLERAISTGIDNDGEKLDRVMPRWRMSKNDLRDVATYVYTKLK